jgi:hypothetical protein
MNAENFHEYLKNPSKLYQINYQELKSLVLQYPFSPNLRYLLLLKSQFENHKESDRNLVSAAIYSLDREQLHKKVQQNSRLLEIHENYSLMEDFLELKDLTTLEDLASNLSSEPTQTVNPVLKSLDIEPGSSETPHESSLNENFTKIDTPEFLENLFVEAEEKESIGINNLSDSKDTELEEFEQSSALPDNADLPVIDEFRKDISASASNDEEQQSEASGQSSDTFEMQQPEEEIKGNEDKSHLNVPILFEDESEKDVTSKGNVSLEITNPDVKKAAGETMPQPVPKDSFNSWLRQLSPPKVKVLSGDLREIALPSTTNEDEQHDEMENDMASDLAEQSIAEDENLASETLAALFEAQGHYTKAIAMYERLSLQNPEKSSFFAAKIEKLKKK